MRGEVIEAANSKFALNRQLKDSKMTVREHFQSVYAQTGVLPLELANEQEVPHLVRYIWNWFEELHQARGNNGFGPNSLSFTEIASWSDLTGRQVQPWEVKVIKDIDICYLSSTMQQADEGKSS